jgi:ribosomal-protein-alanine N-acetyltransferase
VHAIEVASFPDPWRLADFQGYRHAPGAFWVARVGAAVAGYLVSLLAAPEAEILNLAVAPDHRERGIAVRLLRHAKDDLRRRGATEVFLEVRRSNTAATALYLREGFALVGVRRGYYRKPMEDALILRCRVGEMRSNDPAQHGTG